MHENDVGGKYLRRRICFKKIVCRRKFLIRPFRKIMFRPSGRSPRVNIFSPMLVVRVVRLVTVRWRGMRGWGSGGKDLYTKRERSQNNLNLSQ